MAEKKSSTRSKTITKNKTSKSTSTSTNSAVSKKKSTSAKAEEIEKKNKLYRLDNDYLVIKNFIAVTFFVVAFFIMSPIAWANDLSKAFLSVFGLLIVALSTALMVEYIVKTARLQTDPDVKRFSSIVTLNSIFGLAIPIFYINIVLYRVFARYLIWMTDHNTVFCEVRQWIPKFLYGELNLYNKLDNLSFLLFASALILFVAGAIYERAQRK